MKKLILLVLALEVSLFSFASVYTLGDMSRVHLNQPNKPKAVAMSNTSATLRLAFQNQTNTTNTSVQNGLAYDPYMIAGWSLFGSVDFIEGTNTTITLANNGLDVNCQLGYINLLAWDGNLRYQSGSGWSGAGLLLSAKVSLYWIVEGEYAGYYIGNGYGYQIDTVESAYCAKAGFYDVVTYGKRVDYYLDDNTITYTQEDNDLYFLLNGGAMVFYVDADNDKWDYYNQCIPSGWVKQAQFIDADNSNGIDATWSATIEWADYQAEDRLFGFLLNESDSTLVRPYDFLTHTVSKCGGTCGNDLLWAYADGVLSISGSGDMFDFGNNDSPWKMHLDSIVSVELADGLTSIGKYAFSGCSGLTSVTIPNNVTSIRGDAFYGCSALTSVTIPNSVKTIDADAFYGCSALPIEEGIRYADTYLVEVTEKTRMTYTIKDGTRWIGPSAFFGCSGLVSITIPNSVTNIGDNAFFGCSGLTSVVWNAVNCEYCSSFAFRDCPITNIIFGSEVIAIPSNLCYEMNGLTSIIIPDNVTSIGSYAFADCDSLTSITISKSVTSIGYAAFEKTQISSVIIPNSVISIGDYAFAGCTKLNSVIIGSSVTSIGVRAFESCTRLYNVTCYSAEPPVAYQSSFANYNVYLNVPCDNLMAYQLDAVFGSFKFIQCLGAEEAVVTTTTVVPTETDATFAWPASATANTYTLTITKDGVVFCTLTFNANGQLLNIAFAPGRNGAAHAPEAELTASGFLFTVTGLDSGSTYTYTINVKDVANNVVANYTGTFTTTGVTTDMESVNTGVDAPTKLIRDGQVLIQRGDRLFDLRGQEVR